MNIITSIISIILVFIDKIRSIKVERKITNHIMIFYDVSYAVYNENYVTGVIDRRRRPD